MVTAQARLDHRTYLTGAHLMLAEARAERRLGGTRLQHHWCMQRPVLRADVRSRAGNRPDRETRGTHLLVCSSLWGAWKLGLRVGQARLGCRI